MRGPCSCSGSLRLAVWRDIDRYVYSMCGDKRPGIGSVMLIATSPGLWALASYRLTHHFIYRFQPRALGKLLAVPSFVMSRMTALICGIEIESGAHIGRGLLINNFGGIVMGAITMGENCTINQGVTLGRSSTVAGKALNDLPTIGDRVFIGPRAIVAGPVALGDDASVAGGSLVTRDVPTCGVAMGVPAKVVSREGSFHQVHYRNMDNDPLRLTALNDDQQAEPNVTS
jgi:serine O-acetyltransferase